MMNDEFRNLMIISHLRKSKERLFQFKYLVDKG
jgi:hypothetical protein